MLEDKIPLDCPKCGNTVFNYPTDPKPDDMITCVKCGTSRKYKDLEAHTLRQAEKATADMLRDAFKGINKKD